MRASRHVVWSIVLSLMVLLSAASEPASAQGDQQPVATIQSSAANFRAGPGLNYDVVAGGYAGEQYLVVARAHGNDRVWYQVLLPDGRYGWISERIVEVWPSPDNVPWLQDNPVKIPYVMDCGYYPPLLYPGANGSVLAAAGLAVTQEPGLGKIATGRVRSGDTFVVYGGPYCTKLSATIWQAEWLIQTAGGAWGYVLERQRDGTPLIALVAGGSPGTGSATLSIGAIALVNVTDDGLRLRTGPATGYAAIERMPAGTSVSLLDGPVTAEGFRWWYVRSATGATGWAVEAADGLQTLIPASGGPVAGVGDFWPPQVTSAYIEQVQTIQLRVSQGTITQPEAQMQLTAVLSQVGADGLAWITRHIPLYDGASGHWFSFADFADALAVDPSPDPSSRLAQDPVGTVVDLIYGNYLSQQQMLDWLGLGVVGPAG